MTESAQVFKGVHDIPVYTDILFNKPLRLWVAVSLYGGTAATVVLTIVMLDSGHARAALICGLLATGAAAGVAALMPRGRPTFRFRLRNTWSALRPRLATSTNDSLLAPPHTIIGNLSFTAHGVYAHYLLSGLPYYLQSTKRRIDVADRHQALSREIPAGTWAFGLSVPQNQRQLVRAMLHGHRDKPRWINACRQMAPVIAHQNPRTRIYWLAMPVDDGQVHRLLGDRHLDDDVRLRREHREEREVGMAGGGKADRGGGGEHREGLHGRSPGSFQAALEAVFPGSVFELGARVVRWPRCTSARRAPQ